MVVSIILISYRAIQEGTEEINLGMDRDCCRKLPVDESPENPLVHTCVPRFPEK